MCAIGAAGGGGDGAHSQNNTVPALPSLHAMFLGYSGNFPAVATNGEDFILAHLLYREGL